MAISFRCLGSPRRMRSLGAQLVLLASQLIVLLLAGQTPSKSDPNRTSWLQTTAEAEPGRFDSR